MNKVLKSQNGQSLVLFVVFIPFIIMLAIYIIDLSYSKYNKLKLDNIASMTVDYGLEHIDNEPKSKMEELINQNDKEIESYNIEINIENKEIIVTLNKSVKGFFGKIINKNVYKEISSYKGYFKDDIKIIERDE